MPDFRRIDIKVNVETMKQIDSTGKTITKANDRFHLVYDELAILCVTFYKVSTDSTGAVTLTESALPSDAVMTVLGDNDFTEGDDLMFYSTQTTGSDNMVDIPGDWFGDATADRSLGQTSIRVDTNTTEFNTVVGNVPDVKKGCYVNIAMLPAGETSRSVLLSDQFVAENAVSTSGGAPSPSDPTYWTAAETQALLNEKVDKYYYLSGLTTLVQGATTYIDLGIISTYSGHHFDCTITQGTSVLTLDVRLNNDGTSVVNIGSPNFIGSIPNLDIVEGITTDINGLTQRIGFTLLAGSDAVIGYNVRRNKRA